MESELRVAEQQPQLSRLRMFYFLLSGPQDTDWVLHGTGVTHTGVMSPAENFCMSARLSVQQTEVCIERQLWA